MLYVNSKILRCKRGAMKLMMVSLFPFFIFFLHSQVVISTYMMSVNSTTKPHLCIHENSLLLFQFKQSFEINEQASADDCEVSYPRTETWNRSNDCCTWDGVTCDEQTGEIIGLDLSCSQLQGILNPNSTLFQLSHLQTLNLAYNDFMSSSIDRAFSGFRSLMLLNLSSSRFSGSVPLEFSHMSNLISLDLTSLYFADIVIEPPIFELLLTNLSQLREISLETSSVNSMFPHNLSSSLQVLNLKETGVFGELPGEIFDLPNLRVLDLSGSLNLYVELPESIGNLKHLQQLSLSYCQFSGSAIPEYLGDSKSLSSLELAFCNLSGSIPESLGNLTQISYLDLSFNNLTGELPQTLENLGQVVSLNLSSNGLGGQIPNIFSNMKKLTSLILHDNLFSGYFPSSVSYLPKLETLDLRYNSLIGPLPDNITGLPNLSTIFLNHNTINGTIPCWLFNLPSLIYLSMSDNQLTGELCEFLQLSSLQQILLGNNNLHGPIPESISKLTNLAVLDLQSNNFSGNVEVGLFSNARQLDWLDLSFNNLSLVNSRMNSTLPSSLTFLRLSSCGVKDLDFLTGIRHLESLLLSYNKLQGQIFSKQAQSYSWGQDLITLNLSNNYLTEIHQLPFPSLSYLDLRSNLLTGPLLMPSFGTRYFFASNNRFVGEIPSSICNFYSLQILDLSNNKLSGAVPQCLGNVSQFLSILDLHSNNFQGTIELNFPAGSILQSLNLRDNRLEGGIPRSLSNCSGLEVLDVGNNHLRDMFPWWLGALPNLQVLSFRANHLYGSISIFATRLSFPALRILDLSQNIFTGVLPSRFFIQLRGMKILNNSMTKFFNDDKDGYYKLSVIIIEKGMEIDIVPVLSIYTTIDLSRNKFHGFIPDAIGSLASLQALNLSHNNFGGPISQAFGNLISLESLDLSSNQLVGWIPQQLTALTYLEVLNLSENHLAGRIPRDNQFNTFESTSYLGNDGLCGIPLSRTCGDDTNDQLVPKSAAMAKNEDENKDFINGFTWQAVLIGFITGMVIGVSLGCLSFFTGKPKWFNTFVDQECSRFQKKKWPKVVKGL